MNRLSSEEKLVRNHSWTLAVLVSGNETRFYVPRAPAMGQADAGASSGRPVLLRGQAEDLCPKGRSCLIEEIWLPKGVSALSTRGYYLPQGPYRADEDLFVNAEDVGLPCPVLVVWSDGFVVRSEDRIQQPPLSWYAGKEEHSGQRPYLPEVVTGAGVKDTGAAEQIRGMTRRLGYFLKGTGGGEKPIPPGPWGESQVKLAEQHAASLQPTTVRPVTSAQEGRRAADQVLARLNRLQAERNRR